MAHQSKSGRITRDYVAPPPVMHPETKKVWKMKLADKLKSGESLCRKWNQGGCSEPCPNGREHRCNAIQKKGNRVCGMKNHRGCDCKNNRGKLK